MSDPYGIQDPDVRNPNRDGMVAVVGLAALFSLPALLALYLIIEGDWGNPLIAPALIGTGLFAIFAFSLLFLAVTGLNQVRHIKAFLASDRPLLRWTYTPGEWQQIKEEVWQEQQGDWSIQFGCLTFLLGLAGLLTGVMIGAEEGFPEMVKYGLGSAVLGAIVGAVIGGVVAWGNHWVARRAYREPRLGQVALGPNEIFANGHYFKADGYWRRFLRIKLEISSPVLLHIMVQVPPRPRMPDEEEWVIVVPSHMVEAVKAAIPQLAPGLTGEADADD